MSMKYDEDVFKRMKRLEGQARGIMRMMEENKDCKDVIYQLSAIRGATDRLIAYIAAMNLEKCVIAEHESGGDTRKVVQEAVDLLIRSK